MKTSILELCVAAAARAIEEALARRGSTPLDRPYSPSGEVARLVRELADGGAPRGLLEGGEAARARDRLDAALDASPTDPLARIERAIGLDREERDVLRLLLAWTIEPRIGLLMGHVHDALERTRPSHAAIADVLHDPLGAAAALDPFAKLRALRIVACERTGPDAEPRLDARVVSYVLTGALAPLRGAAGRLVVEDRPHAPDADADRVATAAGADVVVLRGAEGSGRTTAARALAAKEGRPWIELTAIAGDGLAELAAIGARDALILGARLCVRGDVEAVADALADASRAPLAIVLDEHAPVPEALHGRDVVRVDLAPLAACDRARVWGRELGRDPADPEVARIAARYSFGPERIRRAAAQGTALGLDGACRAQLGRALATLGVRPRTPARGWDRLVLPAPAMDSLRAACRQVAHRDRVGEAWGFGRHHQLGHGTKLLFFGRPGTGKTLAAEVLAFELDMPLYCIDLSRVVSKWIGETEKNLARVFDEARASHAVLFFDEADALFARRTAVQSSTDRYANMEVNYLLQRLDEHDGVVILATNLKGNLDDGFARRLHFAIEFPEPDAGARERIWQLSFPAEAPLAADVDLSMLARRFEVPGGAIRNAALGAAYLAAADDGPIRLRHIGDALKREYAKMDRLYQRGELEALTGRVA